MTLEKNIIIPTIFSKSLVEFKEKFEKVKDLCEYFHIDLMDGEFVEGRSVDINELSFIKDTSKRFGVHLMCKEPQKYFQKIKELEIKNVWIHIEVFSNDEECKSTLNELYSQGLEGGLSINPETEITELEPFFNITKAVMIMSVHPGAQGQGFIEETYDKIKWIKEKNPEIIIQVDGGIKLEEIRELAKVGAHRFCIGSYLNEAQKPIDNFILLKAAMDLGLSEK